MTKTAIAKCKTPFHGPVPWAWNFSPTGGTPDRARCQAVATDAERQTAAKIIGQYRTMEKLAAQHDIESREAQLDNRFTGPKGVHREALRREIAQCDHDQFLAAQERLGQLRNEALALIQPYLKRLITSIEEALSAYAIVSEQRLEAEAMPICDGNSWTLHNDGVCQTLWFRRGKVEKVLAEIEPGSAIGAVQYFMTNEAHTPFTWN